MFVTLPILAALSAPALVNATAHAPKPVPQQMQQTAQAVDTITCPLNGEQIPSCCCPVKK